MPCKRNPLHPTYLLRPQPHEWRQGYAMLFYAMLFYSMLCYAAASLPPSGIRIRQVVQGQVSYCMYVCMHAAIKAQDTNGKKPGPSTFSHFFFPPLSLLNRPTNPNQTISFTITRAPRRARLLPIMLIYFYYVVARHHRELGLLQRGPQLGVARVDELGGFQLGFITYPARHGTLAS